MAPAGSGESLADILERVLDKGIVVAGDIMVSVLDVELLSLKVRLLVVSVDTAREMGIDWWTRDAFLTSGALARENSELRSTVERLERSLALPASSRAEA
ncbi:gas vesicle protein [Phytohabitans sp. ZYX-F-186]|uniref:Gas vesicle protein n=1 Tax=Phytohabitans maris TaxID=3071409 RepID=A0ABU0ZTR8_9ACTN|nr:gas vesicle protein [Phytohabitans sp. ZYX-F-186]MDQ7910438.1 gas vesicle protein [Phytohabitans sp. ZYX-F-186]